MLIVLFVAKPILQGSSLLLKAWGKKINSKIDSRINTDLIPLFSKIVRLFVIITAGLMILSKFGIKVGPFIASLGNHDRTIAIFCAIKFFTH